MYILICHVVGAGDLKTYLLARRHLVYEKSREDSDEISSRRLTCIANDIAKALSYLAELKYVHRQVTFLLEFGHSKIDLNINCVSI